MDYVAEFRLIEKRSQALVRTHTKDFSSDSDDAARKLMGLFALDYEAKHGDEACVLHYIYRKPADEDPILIYSR